MSGVAELPSRGFEDTMDRIELGWRVTRCIRESEYLVIEEAAIDDFGRQLGCALFGLSAACSFLVVAVAALAGLIIAGVL